MALDKNPQYMSVQVGTDGADTYNETEVVLPLGLVGGAQQNMAFEQCWVVWDNDSPLIIASQVTSVEGHWATQSRTQIGSFNNPEILDKHNLTFRTPTGTPLTTTVVENRPTFHNFMTADGHGVLYATPKLFVAVDAANNGVVRSVRTRMYYRMAKVNATELLGLASQLVAQ